MVVIQVDKTGIISQTNILGIKRDAWESEEQSEPPDTELHPEASSWPNSQNTLEAKTSHVAS